MKKSIEFTERGILLPPEIDDVTRREFLVGGAGLLLLPAACGGDGESGEASGETRMVEHFAGTTEVPVEPERVVVLDNTIAAGLVHLGLVPAGAADQIEGQLEDVGDLLPEDFDVGGIEPVGTSTEANLEAIAEIGPDMIIASDFEEEIYERLSDISPTVLVEWGATETGADASGKPSKRSDSPNAPKRSRRIRRGDVIVMDIQLSIGPLGFAGLEEILDQIAEELHRR